MIRDFRKPLVVFSPKKLLRFKGACSDISEFGKETEFRTVIDDENVEQPSQIKRVLIS